MSIPRKNGQLSNSVTRYEHPQQVDLKFEFKQKRNSQQQQPIFETINKSKQTKEERIKQKEQLKERLLQLQSLPDRKSVYPSYTNDQFKNTSRVLDANQVNNKIEEMQRLKDQFWSNVNRSSSINKGNNTTKYSENASPKGGSFITKLVYKQVQGDNLKLPNLNHIRSINHTPQHESPFITERATDNSTYYNQRKQIQQKVEKSNNSNTIMPHSPEEGNSSHIKVYQEQLEERSGKITQAIEHQIEQFSSQFKSQKEFQIVSPTKRQQTCIHQQQQAAKQRPDFRSIDEIESKLITDLSNCKICSIKMNKNIADYNPIKIKEALLLQSNTIESQKNSIRISIGDGLKGILRASYKPQESNQDWIKNLRAKNNHSKQKDYNDNNDYIDAQNKNKKGQSLPRIEKNSSVQMLQQVGSQPSNETNSMLQSQQYFKTIKNKKKSKKPKEEDMSQDQLVSSFLKKQEQKLEFRQKLKEMFEKHDNKDDFIKYLLLNIQPPENESVKKEDKKTVEHKEAPILMKQGTISLGGLGLKIKQNIIKESETEQNQKIYDYLFEQRERQEVLSFNIKNTFSSKNQEQTQDLLMEFVKECYKNKAVPLPLAATKIQNNNYVLMNYQLNEGIVKALSQSFKYSHEKLHQVMLVNNQLNDENFATFISSLNATQLQAVKSIVYQRNEFGQKSLETLQNLYLSKFPPHQLDELKISQCKLQGGVINSLLQSLSNTCFLKKLQLSKCKLNDFSVNLLMDILTKDSAPNLIDLDISWNELTSNQMGKIIASLRNNTRLQNLNLSWNEIKEDVDLNPFVSFIRKNNHLIHLDLSNMLSCQKQIKTLIKAIKKSRSLQSLHLNQGSIIWKSGKLVDYIQKKLGAIIKSQKKLKKPSVQLLYKDNWKEQLKFIIQKEIGENEINYYHSSVIESQEGISDNSYFVLTRVLGHPEMKGADQWQINKECFICGRWTYTLFCYLHEESAQTQKSLLQPNAPNLVPANSNLFGKSITIRNTKQPEKPLIPERKVEARVKGSYDSIMKDRQNQLINILDFCKILDPFFKSEDDLFQHFFEGLDDNMQLQYAKNSQLKEQKMREIKADIYEKYLENWKSIYRQRLVWNKPQCIPSSINPLSCGDNLYVMADFVKPTNTMEQASIDDHSVLFFPIVRKEDFKPMENIKKKETQYEEKFADVFQEWKVDTDDTHRQMIENDIKHWKIHKFVKDPQDIKNIEAVIYKYIKQLKDIFISLISDSGYPYLTWLDFARFIKDINVVDEKLPLSAIDRHFIATNVEEESLQENPDRALCRYEFYEVFLRIAGQKYKDTKICETYAEALEKLIVEHVIKHANPFPWQQFRDEELWTRDVNLVFDANIDGLQKLYKKYFAHKQNYMTLADAVNLVCKDSNVQMNYKDATLSYGLSKMTVKNEMEKAFNPYKRLAFVEFLEFLGRVAYDKYKSLSLPLYQKIEKILDDVLLVVNVARKEIQRKVELETQMSDESLDEAQLQEGEKAEDYHFAYCADNKYLKHYESEEVLYD